MKTTETESERRYNKLMTQSRVAGPDDPIYSSGLATYSVHLPSESPMTLSAAQDKTLTDQPTSSDPKLRHMAYLHQIGHDFSQTDEFLKRRGLPITDEYRYAAMYGGDDSPSENDY